MRDSRPDIEKIKNALDPIISKSTKNIFIVLDGLDEFPEKTKTEKRSDLLSLIRTLVTKPYSKNLHILVASKVEDDIRTSLEGLGDATWSFNVENGIRQDLDSFIEATMEQDPSLSKLNPALKDDIKNRLNEGEERSVRHPCRVSHTDKSSGDSSG